MKSLISELRFNYIESVLTRIKAELDSFSDNSTAIIRNDIDQIESAMRNLKSLHMADNCIDTNKQIALVWEVDDVKKIRPYLHNEECREVLRMVESKYDADRGVTRNDIGIWADRLFPTYGFETKPFEKASSDVNGCSHATPKIETNNMLDIKRSIAESFSMTTPEFRLSL